MHLRSTGQDYTDAVLALRTAVVGIEDEQFIEEWNNRPVAAVQTKAGRTIYHPQPEDNIEAHHILMALLARRGITFRSRNVSTTGRIPDFNKVADGAGATPTKDLAGAPGFITGL